MPDIFKATEQIPNESEPTQDRRDQPDSPPPAVPQEEMARDEDVSFDDLPMTVRKTPRRRMHIFSSFCEKPYDVTFQTQEPGERILLFLRKSNITNIPWIAGVIMLTILPLGLLFFRLDQTALAFFPIRLWPLLVFFYYLIIMVYAYVNFITWYYNVMLITDRRIVDVDFSDLVYKDIAETTLTLVQDVSYQQTGVIRTVFDYGDVLIQTAGTLENFELKALPQPERIVEVVESLIGHGGSPFNR